MMRRDMVLPRVNLDDCIRCGRCVASCPEGAVALVDGGESAGRPFFVRPEACTYCGVCETICPAGAIQLSYVIVWGVGAVDDRG